MFRFEATDVLTADVHASHLSHESNYQISERRLSHWSMNKIGISHVKSFYAKRPSGKLFSNSCTGSLTLKCEVLARFLTLQFVPEDLWIAVFFTV